MTKYEMMLITRPDVPEEEIDNLNAQMEGVISGAGGKTEKIDKMGRRRLAYHVKKQREGFYVLFTFEGNGDTVREFERRLKVTDSVIKFLAVRIDERKKPAKETKPAAEPPAPAASGSESQSGAGAPSQN